MNDFSTQGLNFRSYDLKFSPRVLNIYIASLNPKIMIFIPGLPELQFLIAVCTNGARKPGEFHHMISGTGDVTYSRHGDIFTFINWSRGRLGNEARYLCVFDFFSYDPSPPPPLPLPSPSPFHSNKGIKMYNSPRRSCW